MKYGISTNQEIDARYWEIPEDLQDAVISEDGKQTVYSIGKEQGIKEQDLWLLNHLVMDILMAIDPIKGFSQRIAEQTHITTPAAQKIAEAINENIFRPVRQSLIQIHEIPQNEQAEIPAVEQHFEHLLETHSPGMIPLAKPIAPRPKTLAEQKMSRPTSLPPQVSRTNNEPDPYREPIE